MGQETITLYLFLKSRPGRGANEPSSTWTQVVLPKVIIRLLHDSEMLRLTDKTDAVAERKCARNQTGPMSQYKYSRTVTRKCKRCHTSRVKEIYQVSKEHFDVCFQRDELQRRYNKLETLSSALLLEALRSSGQSQVVITFLLNVYRLTSADLSIAEVCKCGEWVSIQWRSNVTILEQDGKKNFHHFHCCPSFFCFWVVLSGFWMLGPHPRLYRCVWKVGRNKLPSKTCRKLPVFARGIVSLNDEEQRIWQLITLTDKVWLVSFRNGLLQKICFLCQSKV